MFRTAVAVVRRADDERTGVVNPDVEQRRGARARRNRGGNGRQQCAEQRCGFDFAMREGRAEQRQRA